MDAVPMLLAQNTVQETEAVLEQTPAQPEGEMSPQWEVMSPKFNPVDVAAQINDVEHMNERDAEYYRDMRESRMLYASNTQQPSLYVNQKKRTTIKGDRDSLRESRTFA